MRIVYGVHGYGRGHATRALASCRTWRRRHQVLVLAGGDAHAAIAPDFPVMAHPDIGLRLWPQKRQTLQLAHVPYVTSPTALDLL